MHKKQNRADTRNKNQRHDVKGEAQNVNIDPSPGKLGGTNKTHEQGSNKAGEGMRQGGDKREKGWSRSEEEQRYLKQRK